MADELTPGLRIAPVGVTMTTSAAGHPLIPQPPATVAALRQAISQIAPATLPAFTRELDQAADQSRQGSALAPLQRFIAQWAVYVHIQRQPKLAADPAAGKTPPSQATRPRHGRPPLRSDASWTRPMRPSASQPSEHGLALGVRSGSRARRERRARPCGGGS